MENQECAGCGVDLLYPQRRGTIDYCEQCRRVAGKDKDTREEHYMNVRILRAAGPHDIRYAVQWTPVEWQVLDTVVARDPMGAFGLGPDGYAEAKALAKELNEAPASREP